MKSLKFNQPYFMLRQMYLALFENHTVCCGLHKLGEVLRSMRFQLCLYNTPCNQGLQVIYFLKNYKLKQIEWYLFFTLLDSDKIFLSGRKRSEFIKHADISTQIVASLLSQVLVHGTSQCK